MQALGPWQVEIWNLHFYTKETAFLLHFLKRKKVNFFAFDFFLHLMIVFYRPLTAHQIIGGVSTVWCKYFHLPLSPLLCHLSSMSVYNAGHE